MTLGPWNGGIGKIETDLVDKNNLIILLTSKIIRPVDLIYAKGKSKPVLNLRL